MLLLSHTRNIVMLVPDDGFTKKPKHVARCGKWKILSENTLWLIVSLFFRLFVLRLIFIWIICCDTKYYKQYLLCKKLSEPAYKEYWNPNSNHGTEEFEMSRSSRTLRKRWYWLKHFSGDHYVVTSSLCALYRVPPMLRQFQFTTPVCKAIGGI